MTDKGALVPPPIPSNQPLDDKFEEALNNAYNGHVDFWKNEHPDGKFEHDNFKEGFTIAWKDADAFAQFDGSRIGRKEAWKDPDYKSLHQARETGFPLGMGARF